MEMFGGALCGLSMSCADPHRLTEIVGTQLGLRGGPSILSIYTVYTCIYKKILVGLGAWPVRSWTLLRGLSVKLTVAVYSAPSP